MNEHEKINYVELPAKDLEATKTFLLKYSIGHLQIMELSI